MTIREVMKDPSTKIVDVRSAMEFRSGHIRGAVNVPLEQLPQKVNEIPGIGQVPVVFYCRSGNRSGQAVRYLRQTGINKIYDGGGFEDMQYLVN